eukprot:TRINITY_DN3198_c0_g1_i3.p1 TRINITY_DN3198_c0_g1~~TRINITY_DN3198_c0_g1_i3.p1  ORF type:complete len:491 (+),score=112.19 TRINITY_DN3198_c0_g1_i3:66-1538(+)
MTTATIKVINGKDLMVADFRSSDPYVIVKLFDKGGSEIGTKQTPVISSDLNPVWDWKGDFSMSADTRVSKLQFILFDKDTVSSDDFMGQVTVNQEDIDMKLTGIATTFNILPLEDQNDKSGADALKSYKKKGTLGKLTVSWEIKYPEEAKKKTVPRVDTSTLSTSSTHTATPRTTRSETMKKQLVIKPLSITGLPRVLKTWQRGDMTITIGEETNTASGSYSQECIRWNTKSTFNVNQSYSRGSLSPDRQKVIIKFEIIDTKGERKRSIALGSKTLVVGDYTSSKVETIKLVIDEDAAESDEEEEEEEEDDFEKINSFDQQLLDQLNEELIVNKSGPQYKKYWEDNNMLLLSPNNINDDWVIMYVALTMMLRGVDNVQVITNDFFRDHYWRMHQHPSLVTWKDRHLTKFFLHDTDRPHPKELAATSASISGGRYRKASFTPPPPFTTSAQRIGRNWFIPTSTIPVTWFAIDMNDGKNTNSIDEVRLLSRT